MAKSKSGTNKSISFATRGSARGNSIAKSGNNIANAINKLQGQINAMEINSENAINNVNDYLADKIYELYVTLSGNDSTGDGSELNPYRTISKGIVEATKLSNLDKQYNEQSRLKDVYYPDGVTPLGTGTSNSNIVIHLPVNPVIINVDEGLYEENNSVIVTLRKYGIIIRGAERQPADLGSYVNQETAINATYDTVEVDFNASGNTPWTDDLLKGLFFQTSTIGIFFGFSLGVIQGNTHNAGTGITTIKITRGSADLVLPTFTWSQANGLFTILENVTEIRGLGVYGIKDSYKKSYNLFIQNCKLAGSATDNCTFEGALLDKCYLHEPEARTVAFGINTCAITTSGVLLTSETVSLQYLGNCYLTSGMQYYAENILRCGFYSNNMRAMATGGDITEIISQVRDCYYDRALIQTSYYDVRANTHLQQIRISDSKFINGSLIDFVMTKMTIARCEFDEDMEPIVVGFGAILYMETNSYVGVSPLIADYFIELEAGGQYVFENGSCPVTGAVALGRINGGATTFSLGAGVRAFENGCLAQGV